MKLLETNKMESANENSFSSSNIDQNINLKKQARFRFDISRNKNLFHTEYSDKLQTIERLRNSSVSSLQNLPGIKT